MSSAASGSGTWWIWMFWRVVMWPLFSGTYFSIDARERIHLIGGDAAERQLDADHLHVGLTLAVDALLEAEADELVLGGLAVEELAGLVVEVVELVWRIGITWPGDVLVDLRVLAGAERPLALLDLVLVLVEVGFGGLRLVGLGLHWAALARRSAP